MVILFWLICHQIDIFFLLWLLGHFTSPSLGRTIFLSFFLMGGFFCTTFFFMQELINLQIIGHLL